jgi:DNA-binding NtrC family response regulator
LQATPYSFYIQGSFAEQTEQPLNLQAKDIFKPSYAVKILIVDDEQLDLFISKKLLSLEHQVDGFSTIPEAVAWAQTNTFDVLLSDYHLGTGVHAHDVLKAIVEVKGKTFKAFVLSNHIDDRQAEELRKVGFTGMIEKPLSLEKFKIVLAS